MKKTCFVLAIVFLLFSFDQKPAADRIYIHAQIWTGDPLHPKATAIAVKDSLIIFVGDDYEAFRDGHTQIIDLAGKMIVPGFIDAHTHFLGGGYQLASVDLRQVKSKVAFIKILMEYARQMPGDGWIQGGDWDHEAWGGELPDRRWIDSISNGHPIWINRYDGHMSLANSLAMKLARVDAHTPNPAGGEIVKDPTGEATGIFRDEAMSLINRAVPMPSPKDLNTWLARASQHALEHGVTQVHDMGSYGGWRDLTAYRDAYANNQLAIRVYSFVPISSWKRLADFVRQQGRGNDHLRWGGLKGFVDGSLGSTTAWFYDPYLDAPSSTGLQVTDTVSLHQWILAADAAGLQVATHAIGDHANDFILNVYADAEQKNGKKDRRFRVEHAQHLSQTAIPRFGSLQVIPSMQPYHAIDDGKWAYKRLDSARLKRTYAFRSLQASGARLAFGSDWTVAPLDPVAGIYAAVTRRTLDDKNPDGWYPAEKISVEDALRAYTVNNAFAGFQESRLGQLKPGMLADFVVLSDDLFQIAPEKIREVKVLRTILNGKEVFLKKD